MNWSERYAAVTKNVSENKWRYTTALEPNGGISRSETKHCGRCDIILPKKNTIPLDHKVGEICRDCRDVLAITDID